MADTSIFSADMVPKKVRSARALKPKNELTNIEDQVLPASLEVSTGKENHQIPSKPKKKSSKSKQEGKQSDLTKHASNNDLAPPEDPVGKDNNEAKKKSKSKKKGKKADTSTTTESAVLTSPSDLMEVSAGKGELENISQPTKKGAPKQQLGKKSFEQEMQEMQEKLEQLRLEKEETEGILKEREEALKLKEEELENRGREQQKLQLELKKLQKLKEFKPSMTFPIVQSLREKKDQEKKKKGGSETKRPSPPYVLWLKDQWTEVKKMNPEAEFKEISSILGAKWKTVSAEEKKPYEEKYQAEKEEYLKVIGTEKRENEAMRLLEDEHKQRTAMELLEQYLQFKQESEKDNKKHKKEKDPSKPKHPISAFFLFMSERRAALLAENMNATEIAKKAGDEWKTMSEEEKSGYEEVAKRNKEQYAAEMEVYKQKKKEETVSMTMEEEEIMKIQKQEALQLLKKKEKTENIIKKTKEKIQKKKQNKIVDPNKPKRPASSYILYCKEARKNLVAERPGISNSALNALMSVKWKEMKDEEKQEWNKRGAEYMEAYKKEMEDYNIKSVSASAQQE